MTVSSLQVRRGPLLPTLIIAAVLIGGFVIFSQIWTDKLWFDAIGFPVVFSTQLWVKVGLFAGFGVLMAGALALNMWLAFRNRPKMRRTGASAILDRYRDLLESGVRPAVIIPAVVVGALAGVSAAAQSTTFLAWANRTPFGRVDPTFGLDLSFYVFEYPVWRFVSSFLLTTLLFSIVAAAAVHFAVGGLASGRTKANNTAAAPARIHLSILIGLTLLVYAVENLLDRYGFLLNQGTLFTGLHYTDDNARLGARLVVAAIAVICALLFFANCVLNRWMIPVTGVVLMLVSGLILSGIYPAIVQSFGVRPSEPDKESPYMQNHINMTRDAFGIADVKIEDYSAVTQVRPGQLKADAAALPGIRLMDPAVVGPTFEQLQQVRGYYSFPEALDVDRYIINGKETDTIVAARELNLAGLPDQNWNNNHTVYTHGYGLVVAYGNRRQTMGEPQWIVRDIPPVGELGEHEARIYYGEKSTNYVIVGREEGQPPIELDTPGGGEGGREKYNTYTGPGGVPMGDIFTRSLYATRFMDLNILLSDRVNSASKILYERTPKERVQQVAPWLTVDSNVYPALVDKRLVWIVDAYTTSDSYPNSQQVSLRQTTSDTQSRVVGTQVETEINYIRNSVKAVVDAYSGEVKLYAWDEADPVLQTYAKAFPDTVRPKSEISPDLLKHLRYPEDLFKVQREILSRYHMTNPHTWYQQTDLWEVPADPVQGHNQTKEPPYYLSIKWPGDKTPIFSQTTVFVPRGRSNLASYFAVIAEATSPDYGKLRVLRMSDTHQIDGPGQTFNAINNDPKVAEKLRPYLNQGASAAEYGNLLTLPMGNGLLYVAPVYTMRQGNTGSYPALRFVVVRFGEHVGIGDTLQAALDQVFEGDAGANTGENHTNNNTDKPPTQTTPPGKADQPAAVAALQRAQAAFTAADAALKRGDLAEYQKKTNEAKAAIAEALRAMGR